MDNVVITSKQRLMVYMVLFLAFEMNAINVAFNNVEGQQLTISYLLGAFFVLTFFRHLLMKNTLIRYFVPILEAILLFGVNYFDMGNGSLYLFVIFVADIILGYAFSYGMTFAVVGYLVIVINYVNKLEEVNQDIIAQFASVTLVSYFALVAVIVFAKKQVIQNIQYKILMDKLIKKTEEAEELAVFKERNRIAGEIHDTVGHTLTTVLIELEAGRLLMDKDIPLAKEKIGIAREQVKKGLSDIRASVRCIHEGEQLMAFTESVHALLKEVQKTTGCIIQEEIDVTSKLLPIQEKTLYNALQEAITNGLKHGMATEFHIEIKEQSPMLQMKIKDNGKGSGQIEKGFGLTNMTEKVKTIGGELQMETQPLKGFIVNIIIPIGDKL